MEHIELVIFDLDDTLCPRDTQVISENTKDIINAFKSRGVIIALASLNYFARFALFKNKIAHAFSMIEYRKYLDKCDTLEERAKYLHPVKARMYKDIMTIMGCKPKNTLVFDDNLIHIFEARKLDMNVCYVDAKKNITWGQVKRCLHGLHRRNSCRF